MSRFENKQKQSFIDSIPVTSIEADDDKLTNRCKFNFSYFDVQPAGQAFNDWTEVQTKRLLEKLSEYSKESLTHWRGVRVGKKSGNILSVYGSFPTKSDFSHPKHVPHEVEWGRFRLDFSCRLVGFVLPSKFDGLTHPKTGKHFDCNTFYVVFLDANHQFYKGSEAK